VLGGGRHAGRTAPSSWPPAWRRYHAFAAPSQLSGDLQEKGPRLTRRDVVVGIRRGPIALVEEVLDIEVRFPGLGDLRVDAGVEAQEARRVDAFVGRRLRSRAVDADERG